MSPCCHDSPLLLGAVGRGGGVRSRPGKTTCPWRQSTVGQWLAAARPTARALPPRRPPKRRLKSAFPKATATPPLDLDCCLLCVSHCYPPHTRGADCAPAVLPSSVGGPGRHETSSLGCCQSTRKRSGHPSRQQRQRGDLSGGLLQPRKLNEGKARRGPWLPLFGGRWAAETHTSERRFVLFGCRCMALQPRSGFWWVKDMANGSSTDSQQGAGVGLPARGKGLLPQAGSIQPCTAGQGQCAASLPKQPRTAKDRRAGRRVAC